MPDDDDDSARICPACNGSGEVGRYTDMICGRCHGSGEVGG